MSLLLLAAIALTGLVAAGLGTMIGLGGGVFIVPVLAIVLGVDLKAAIAAGAVCVVFNSLRSSSVYLDRGLVNLRLAMVLLLSTALAAAIGGLIVVFAPVQLLKVVFALLLGGVVAVMVFGPDPSKARREGPDPWKLRGTYRRVSTGKTADYVPHHLRTGVGLSGVAGLTSGMLGIGGGAIQVPIMNTLMGVPLRVAVATSTFMVGITAVVSALIYAGAGLIDAAITVPALAGVLLGSRFGSHAGTRVKAETLRTFLIIILSILAIAMAYDGLFSA